MLLVAHVDGARKFKMCLSPMWMVHESSKCLLSPTWMVHGSSKCACRPSGWCTEVQNVYFYPHEWRKIQKCVVLVARVHGGNF